MLAPMTGWEARGTVPVLMPLTGENVCTWMAEIAAITLTHWGKCGLSKPTYIFFLSQMKRNAAMRKVRRRREGGEEGYLLLFWYRFVKVDMGWSGSRGADATCSGRFAGWH